jgi:hypothetical protein
MLVQKYYTRILVTNQCNLSFCSMLPTVQDSDHVDEKVCVHLLVFVSPGLNLVK